jgi:uncharacterized protein
VTSSRNPFRVNVGFIVSQSIGYSRDFHFDFSAILLRPDLDLSQFNGFARITRTPQGLLVQARFNADTMVECVRCLTDVVQPLHTEFDELYAFSTRTTSESDLILPEDANIDLEPIIREYFLLEIPISPLCKPDCKGLCIECGENLNLTTCEHQSLPNAHIL